jgi:hypothetical protein
VSGGGNRKRSSDSVGDDGLIVNGKRVKLSSPSDLISSDEDDGYYFYPSSVKLKQSPAVSANSGGKLKSKLKSIKNIKFEELEDVDDDTDNQIPII